MNRNEDEVDFAIEALRQADRDMVGFELEDGDGEDTLLGEGSTYERIKIRVDRAIDAIDAIEAEGLTSETAAKGTLALLESVLLTPYECHLGIIEAAIRMTDAARGRVKA